MFCADNTTSGDDELTYEFFDFRFNWDGTKKFKKNKCESVMGTNKSTRVEELYYKFHEATFTIVKHAGLTIFRGRRNHPRGLISQPPCLPSGYKPGIRLILILIFHSGI